MHTLYISTIKLSISVSLLTTNVYLNDVYESEQHQSLTCPFKDATKTPNTEISSQGGVGDISVRTQWNLDMNPIQVVLFSTRQTEQFTRRQEYLHERCNYFSS